MVPSHGSSSITISLISSLDIGCVFCCTQLHTALYIWAYKIYIYINITVFVIMNQINKLSLIWKWNVALVVYELPSGSQPISLWSIDIEYIIQVHFLVDYSRVPLDQLNQISPRPEPNWSHIYTIKYNICIDQKVIQKTRRKSNLHNECFISFKQIYLPPLDNCMMLNFSHVGAGSIVDKIDFVNLSVPLKGGAIHRCSLI